MNHNGIPDCLERPGCRVSIVNPGCGSPVVTARVTGPDMNHNGIPDCLERPGCGVSAFPGGAVPMAAAQVTGPDMNLNGIPDALERPAYPGCGVPALHPGPAVIHRVCGAPVATARVTGPDMNHNGIPDCLERPGCGVPIVNPGCGSLRHVGREELISRGILLEKCSSGQMIPVCSPGCGVPMA